MGEHGSRFIVGDFVRIKTIEDMISTYDLEFTTQDIREDPYECDFETATVAFVGSMWQECGDEHHVSKVKVDSEGRYYYRLDGSLWSFDTKKGPQRVLFLLAISAALLRLCMELCETISISLGGTVVQSDVVTFAEGRTQIKSNRMLKNRTVVAERVIFALLAIRVAVRWQLPDKVRIDQLADGFDSQSLVLGRYDDGFQSRFEISRYDFFGRRSPKRFHHLDAERR